MAASFHIPSKSVRINHLTISSYKVTDTLPGLPDHEDEELQNLLNHLQYYKASYPKRLNVHIHINQPFSQHLIESLKVYTGW